MIETEGLTGADILPSVFSVFNKLSHFAGGVLTPPLTKGDARPLWKPHNVVPPQEAGFT